MATLPPGGLKVATTIPIETAAVDNGEELKKVVSFSFVPLLSETYKLPVEDPERAFQALLNVREVVRKKTLNELKVTLVSGEDGVVGATYEGNWYVNNESIFSRFTLVETENVDYYKRLEIDAHHTHVSSGLSSPPPERWKIEVKQGEEEGAWQIVFRVKYDMFANKILLVFCGIHFLAGTILVSIAALVLFPVTMVAHHYYVQMNKQQILLLYRYLLGLEGATLPKPSIGVAQPVQSGVGGKEALTESDELAKLFVLFKTGALTKEEYEVQKGKIIGV